MSGTRKGLQRVVAVVAIRRDAAAAWELADKRLAMSDAVGNAEKVDKHLDLAMSGIRKRLQRVVPVVPRAAASGEQVDKHDATSGARARLQKRVPIVVEHLDDFVGEMRTQ